MLKYFIQDPENCKSSPKSLIDYDDVDYEAVDIDVDYYDNIDKDIDDYYSNVLEEY